MEIYALLNIMDKRIINQTYFNNQISIITIYLQTGQLLCYNNHILMHLA